MFDHPLYRHLQAEYGVPVAMPVARASLGLMAVLRAWVAEGHAPSVALCANVCHDVVAAVLGANCHPVFVDIEPTSGCVPEAEWARAHASGASAAIAVHLYGNPADVALVRRHFPREECLLIDDAAQALGVRTSDGIAGSQGDVGLLSFGPTKHIEAGGAAVLLANGESRAAVERELAAVPVLPEAQAAAFRLDFRRRLETARRTGRECGGAAASAMNALLDGYTPLLGASFPAGSASKVMEILPRYALACELRRRKARQWRDGLADTGLVAVEGGSGNVPWRYTCRLPGIDWAQQYRIGEALRARGIDVSHWYLPAHWMCGEPIGSLPGVERMAQEVFQFWVDEGTSVERIQAGVVSAAELLREMRT